jgi:hypothetical protein
MLLWILREEGWSNVNLMHSKTRDRWKRAGIAFATAIVAEAIVGVSIASIDGLDLWGEHVFGFVYFASILVVPGWFVALPIILHHGFDRLHPGQQVLIGSLIGPTIMAAGGIYGALASGAGSRFSPQAFDILYVALGVSFLTSVLYVTTLKYLSSKNYVLKSS